MKIKINQLKYYGMIIQLLKQYIQIIFINYGIIFQKIQSMIILIHF